MGKGTFVNQKLGKRVSRRFDLLKSQIAGRTNRGSASAPFPPPPRGSVPGKPSKV
jgi:hypothetical protein